MIAKRLCWRRNKIAGSIPEDTVQSLWNEGVGGKITDVFVVDCCDEELKAAWRAGIEAVTGPTLLDG